MISREEHAQGLTLVTVSDIGSNHRALLLPNQDSVDFIIDGEDFVLAVSDGVGSCSKAELGSKEAVASCIRVFTLIKNRIIEFESDNVVDALINEWRVSLDHENLDDCCATLKAIFKIGQVMKVVSVGDGFIAVSSDGLNLLSPTEEMAFSNETSCLCSRIEPRDFWTSDFNLDTHKPYAAFCCTDGVANGLVTGQELNLIRDIEVNTSADMLKQEIEALLEDISDYCFDDKTVGVVKYE